MRILSLKAIVLATGLALMGSVAAYAQAPAEINGGMNEVVAPPSDKTVAGAAAVGATPAATTPEAEGAMVIKTGQPAEIENQQGLNKPAPASDVTKAAPNQATDLTPMPTLEAPVAKAVPVDNDPNLFFDAESLVPSGEMGTKSSGPKKVNPQLQPASRLVVVKKDAASNSTEAKLVSADRAIKLGRYDAALDMYESLYQKNKHDPRVLMGRAVSMQHLGQYDSAMQSYQELLDLKPDNVEAKINMLGLLSTKFPAVALRELLDMRDNNPDSVGVVAQIAVTEAQLGNLDDALKYLGEASSIEPHNATHMFNMAVIADRGGKIPEAVQYYEKALETDAVYGHNQSIPRDAVYERLAQLR